MTKLYLAYGSNMNKAQMRHRCPAATPKRAIVIDDARLVFRGVADIEFCAGAQVPVVLWEITEACERALDKFEGVASGVYEKVQIPLDNGESALTYVMRTKGIYPPKREYFERIAQGYADFNIDREALDVALKHSHVKQQHSPETRKRMVRDIAGGNVVRAQKPMHVPLSKVDPSAATSTVSTRTNLTSDLCRHGWPIEVCEFCSPQGLLPLPKPDPRYDGYNWSERAKAGTRAQVHNSNPKNRVVYSDRDTHEKGAKIVRAAKKRANTRSTTTRYKNLSDYMKAKGYSGENH